MRIEMPGRVEVRDHYADEFADLDARIYQILFKIRRGEADDILALLPELERLRKKQADLAIEQEAEALARHPELLLG